MNQLDFLIPSRPTKELSIIILGSIIPSRSKTMPPKSLRIVGTKTLIQHQFDILEHLWPNAEKILVAGHKARNIICSKPKKLKIVENPTYENNGGAEEIRLGLNIVSNHSVLIIGGDVCFDDSIRKIDRPISTILAYNKIVDGEIGVGIIGKVQTFAYNIPHTWTDIALIREPELNIMSKFVNQKTKSTYLFHEVMNHVAERADLYSILTEDSIKKI